MNEIQILTGFDELHLCTGAMTTFNSTARVKRHSLFMTDISNPKVCQRGFVFRIILALTIAAQIYLSVFLLRLTPSIELANPTPGFR